MNKKNISRRDLLKGGVASAVYLVLNGCSVLPKLKECNDGGNPVIEFNVDVHNHIFNGQDVDVSAFTYHNLMRLFPEPSKLTPDEKKAIDKASRVIEKVAYSVSTDAETEQREIENNQEEIRQLFKESSPFYDVQQLASTQNKILHKAKILDKKLELIHENNSSKIFSEIDQALKGLEQTNQQDKMFVGIKQIKDYIAIVKKIRKAFQKYKQFKYLSGYRFHNALALAEKYKDVHLFTPALVDMHSAEHDTEYYSGEEKITPIDVQIELMRSINELSEGRFLPMVSYDPRLDVLHNGEYFNQVKDALTKKGFVGVKLYPPTGFRPIGNDKLRREIMLKGVPVSRVDIDSRLTELYKWCDKHRVPIMAHSNNSMGHTKEYDYYSHPIFWQPVLKEYKNIPINLGHFGGMEDLSKNGVGDWPWFVVELMTRHSNLYADLSNFNDMAGKAGASKKALRRYKYFDNLSSMIASFENQAPKGSVLARKRLMYGTDWHMLASEVGHEKYFDNFKRHLNNSFCGDVENIMGRNAVRFLGLDVVKIDSKQQHHVEWLADFLKRKNMMPGWLMLLPPKSILRKELAV